MGKKQDPDDGTTPRRRKRAEKRENYTWRCPVKGCKLNKLNKAATREDAEMAALLHSMQH